MGSGGRCYLECAGPRNRQIYEHLGYEMKEQFTLRIKGDEAGWEEFTDMSRRALARAVTF